MHGEQWKSDLTARVGKKGYHAVSTGVYTKRWVLALGENYCICEITSVCTVDERKGLDQIVRTDEIKKIKPSPIRPRPVQLLPQHNHWTEQNPISAKRQVLLYLKVLGGVMWTNRPGLAQQSFACFHEAGRIPALLPPCSWFRFGSHSTICFLYFSDAWALKVMSLWRLNHLLHERIRTSPTARTGSDQHLYPRKSLPFSV